jgi:hypothetical protein
METYLYSFISFVCIFSSITVRVTPTQDIGKILQGFYDITSDGEADVLGAIQTAQVLSFFVMLKLK